MMHLCSLTGQSQAARLYRCLQERKKPMTAMDIHEVIGTMAPSTIVSNVRKALEIDPRARHRLVTVPIAVPAFNFNVLTDRIIWKTKTIPAYALEEIGGQS